MPVSVKGNPFNSSNFYLIPVGTDGGSPMLIGECDWLWDDEELNKLEGWEDFLMKYEDQDIGFCYIGGKWYLTRDTEFKYEVGRYEFPTGIGFIVKVGAAHKGLSPEAPSINPAPRDASRFISRGFFLLSFATPSRQDQLRAVFSLLQSQVGKPYSTLQHPRILQNFADEKYLGRTP